MDSIYEAFNEIELDLNEFEELDMNELEVKRLKKTIECKIKKDSGHKRVFKRLGIVAASIVVLILSYTFIGKPILAHNQLAIDGIIERLSYGADYKNIKDYSTIVNQSVTDKNISVTVTEVVLDDNIMKVAYKIYAPDMDIKAMDSISIFQATNIKINGKSFNAGFSGNNNYIDNHTVEVVKELIITRKNLPKNFRMEIYCNELFKTKGDWKFNFRVSKESILKKSETTKLNKSLSCDELNIKLEKVSISPLTTALIYSFKGDMPIFGFIILDENGREIPEGAGEFGMKDGKGSGVSCFYSLSDINVNKITIVPWVQKEDGKKSGKLAPIELSDKIPHEIKQNETSSIIINSVSFEKNIVVLEYKVKGYISPISQSRSFNVVDEKNNRLLEYTDYEKFSLNEFNKRYMESETFVRAFKLNGSKKYYLEVSDLKGSFILEDKKIEVYLKK